MHWRAADDFAAKGLGDGLMPEAYAEDWALARPFADHLDRCPGVLGAPRARGDDDRLEWFGGGDGDTVATHHVNPSAKLF